MRQRRRLLVASQPLDAGVPRQVLDVVTALDPDGYEVDVACPRESLLWAGLEGREGVRLHEIAAAREPAPADARTLVVLGRLVARANIVHAHSAKAGFLARLAATLRGRRRRCVFSPHAWSFWAADGARAEVYRRLEQLGARCCRMILVVSAHERDAGLAAGVGRPEQYRVVVNGVDLERFAADPAPVPGRILVVGRLTRQKRIDVAVRAFAELRRGHPGAKLHVAGDGPEREAIERLALDLGLREAVSLLGTREDVPELLVEASCLVLPSDYEGCPLTVLEAMAAGVPVVASSVGGVPELVEHGRSGLLVPPGRPAELAAAVATVLDNPERARSLAAEGRRVARERFSRERMVEETLAVYDEVVRQ